MLDKIVVNKLKSKNKSNNARAYEPKIDGKFGLCNGTSMDPLPVVTFSLRRGKKNGVKIIASLTYLWYSGATNIMMNRKHTGPYYHEMLPNKVYYSTFPWPYKTTHNVKVTFCMPEFYISKII